MGQIVGQAAGITVELDVERLSNLISKRVAAELAGLFPAEPGEFWAALSEQAQRERQRLTAMFHLTCTSQNGCPHQNASPADVPADDNNRLP